MFINIIFYYIYKMCYSYTSILYYDVTIEVLLLLKELKNIKIKKDIYISRKTINNLNYDLDNDEEVKELENLINITDKKIKSVDNKILSVGTRKQLLSYLKQSLMKKLPEAWAALLEAHYIMDMNLIYGQLVLPTFVTFIVGNDTNIIKPLKQR